MKKVAYFPLIFSVLFSSCSRTLSYNDAKKWVDVNYTFTDNLTPTKCEYSEDYSGTSGDIWLKIALEGISARFSNKGNISEDGLQGFDTYTSGLSPVSPLNSSTFLSHYSSQEAVKKVNGKFTVSGKSLIYSYYVFLKDIGYEKFISPDEKATKEETYNDKGYIIKYTWKFTNVKASNIQGNLSFKAVQKFFYE